MSFIGDAPSIDLAMLRKGMDVFEHSLSAASRTQIARENLVHNVLDNLMTRASVIFTDFTERFWPSLDKACVNQFKDLPRNFQKVQYADIANEQISTMEGFDGQYIDYGPVVLESLNFYENVLDKQLQSYRVLLARLITNQKDQTSYRSTDSDIKFAQAQREADDRANAVFWANGSFKSQTTVSQVVGRISEIPDIFATGKAIQAKLRRTDMKEIHSRVKDIWTMIGVLIEAINKKSMDSLNDTQLKNIAYGVMDLARNVEHYGLSLYRANVYLSALDRLNAVITKAA